MRILTFTPIAWLDECSLQNVCTVVVGGASDQHMWRKTARRDFAAADGEPGTSPSTSSALLLSSSSCCCGGFFLRDHEVDHLLATGTTAGGEGEREVDTGELQALSGWGEAYTGEENSGEETSGEEPFGEETEKAAPGLGLVCINLQRVPYGQVPNVWKVLHISVLYLGCLRTGRSSCLPWANWHLRPYLQAPVSTNDRHSSVL